MINIVCPSFDILLIQKIIEYGIKNLSVQRINKLTQLIDES